MKYVDDEPKCVGSLVSSAILSDTLNMRLLCADDEEDIRTILELALGLDPDVEATIVSSGSSCKRARIAWKGSAR